MVQLYSTLGIRILLTMRVEMPGKFVRALQNFIVLHDDGTHVETFSWHA